jgi:subtilase family serine protease
MGLAVDYPASSEFVTGIGGTTLQAEGAGTYFSSSNNSPGQGSALSYIPEATWNDGFQNATGGGSSILVAKPSWQTGIGVPNDGHRDVPDLAFTASPNTDGLLFCTPPPSNSTYTTCVNGTFRNSDTSLNVTGGTSTGPPTMAGILAMLVQQS